jgi:hypothetical protein
VPYHAKEKTVLNSVRVRITAWYTAIMALVLVLLSLFTYTIFWKNTVQQTDAELSELAGAFLVTFQDELQDISHREAQPTEDLSELRAAARQAMLEHHFRDHLFAVVDSSGNVVISSEDAPLGVSPRGDSSAGAVSRDSFAHEGSIASLLSSRSFRSLIVSASKGQAFQTVQSDKRKYRGYARLSAG